MERYIDAEKITSILTDIAQASRRLYPGIMTSISQINAMPSADVWETKHGEWIQVDDNKCCCSNCGIITFIAVYPNGNKNYCPNCGAKMDRKGRK